MNLELSLISYFFKKYWFYVYAVGRGGKNLRMKARTRGKGRTCAPLKEWKGFTGKKETPGD